MFFGILLITTQWSGQVFAQTIEFYPEIFNFPNLNTDSFAVYKAKCEEFQRIMEMDIVYDSLNEEQKELLDSEYRYIGGPYNTEPIGCSWYCAASFDTAVSTSTLDSGRSSAYEAMNIHDFDLSTSWVEGKEGDGRSEGINIVLDLYHSSDLALTHIKIFNGYCKSEKTWNENGRVKTFAMYINGEFVGNLNLEDTYREQVFEIGSFHSDERGSLSVTLIIVNVYKGDKYSDTAVSEINFDGTGDH